MGRGYTSHNVWPVSSSAASLTVNANSNAKELSSSTLIKEDLKKEKDDNETETADKIVKILTPLIESIKGLGEGKGDETIEKKLDAAKQREKVFIVCLIVFGLLAFFSFLSAVWSANSVEKLLRILYKMKQSKS